jgi:hypothetical protein
MAGAISSFLLYFLAWCGAVFSGVALKPLPITAFCLGLVLGLLVFGTRPQAKEFVPTKAYLKAVDRPAPTTAKRQRVLFGTLFAGTILLNAAILFMEQQFPRLHNPLTSFALYMGGFVAGQSLIGLKNAGNYAERYNAWLKAMAPWEAPKRSKYVSSDPLPWYEHLYWVALLAAPFAQWWAWERFRNPGLAALPLVVIAIANLAITSNKTVNPNGPQKSHIGYLKVMGVLMGALVLLLAFPAKGWVPLMRIADADLLILVVAQYFRWVLRPEE